MLKTNIYSDLFFTLPIYLLRKRGKFKENIRKYLLVCIDGFELLFVFY